MKLLIQDTALMRRSTFQLLSACLAVILISPANAGVPIPVVPKAIKGKHCVESVPYMRRNHMKLLLHQRHETMHLGIRDTKYSLNGCLTCHAVLDKNNQPVTIKSKKHFCNSCMVMWALKLIVSVATNQLLVMKAK